MLSQQLLLTLPEEIITNHILPYTYSPITFELSQDIKNYVDNQMKLKERYRYSGHHIMLFRNLITYLREISNISLHVCISEKFVEIMSRHVMLRNHNKEHVLKYILKKIIKPKNLNYRRFFSLLFGLMNIEERNSFMNDIVSADTIGIIPLTSPELQQILSG
jgi:hypothetical protein